MTASLWARLARSRDGNFGLMTAVLLPVLLGSAGVALDFSNAMQIKSKMQGLADAAALAAASSMAQKNISETDAQELATDYLAGQILANGIDANATPEEKAEQEDAIRKATAVSAKTTTNSASSKGYTVALNTKYTMKLNPITSLIGGSSITLNIAATASSSSETTTGISMYLALDRSGSMSFVTTVKNSLKSSCVNYTATNWAWKDTLWPSSPCYIRKIEALQTAATALFSSLQTSDPKSTLVRVGAVSYNDEAQSPTAMAWGTTNAAKYVADLPSVPTGGTDATDAMTLAFEALKASNTTEATAHTAKGNATFNRFIVLMTDGEMTGNSSNWNNSLDKKVRTECATAKADGIKIFTVAFMAPDRGKSLLSTCASASDYYYEPEDMTDLVNAFGDIANKAAKSSVRLTN
jgi:Flp pilus assembly protein TadG/uncharacterized protein YegL